MNDADNIKQFLDGDADALCSLIETYRKPLFSFILELAGRDSDADEIFQEVWLKAIHALPRYNHKGRFASWLFKIAHRQVIDRSRKRKWLLFADMGTETAPPLPKAVSHITPTDTLSNYELGCIIRSAVTSLPTEQKEVFLLRMDADLSFKEIANIQKTSINTVLARMSYAKQKLREQLSGLYKELT